MLAAVTALRERDLQKIIVAVPVGAKRSCAMLRQCADEVVCALTSGSLGGVGAWYDDFTQVDDTEVRRLLSAEAGAA